MNVTASFASTERLVVRLGTTNAEADASAVASTMQAIVAIVKEANSEIKSNQELLIKARPFSKGSFEIPFELSIEGATIGFATLPLIQTILDIFEKYLSIRKQLKGEALPPPLNNGEVIINGDVIIQNSVVNLVNNRKISDVVDKAIGEVESDATIKNIQIIRGQNDVPVATIDRGDFAYFKKKSHVAGPELPRKNRSKEAELVVHTTVLEGTSKWTFIYDGHNIKAEISDESFMEDVRKGNESFAAGDRLIVILGIEEEYNSTLATYEKKYSVLKVVSHVKQRRRGGEDTLF